MAIHLGRSLPNASRDRPERRRGRPARRRRPKPRRLPLLLGLAPGGVYPAAAVAGSAVRSYRTISPLPPATSRAAGSAVCFCGTFPGVAPAGRYPAPCLHGARTFLPAPCGARRPSGRLALQIKEPARAKSIRAAGRRHRSDTGDGLGIGGAIAEARPEMALERGDHGAGL